MVFSIRVNYFCSFYLLCFSEAVYAQQCTLDGKTITVHILDTAWQVRVNHIPPIISFILRCLCFIAPEGE